MICTDFAKIQPLKKVVIFHWSKLIPEIRLGISVVLSCRTKDYLDMFATRDSDLSSHFLKHAIIFAINK